MNRVIRTVNIKLILSLLYILSLSLMSNFDKKEKRYLSKIEKSPDKNENYNDLIRLYLDNGKYGKVIYFITTHQINFNENQRNEYLFTSYIHLNNVEKANTILDKLENKNNKYFEWGDYYLKTSNHVMAKNMFLKSYHPGFKELVYKKRYKQFEDFYISCPNYWAAVSEKTNFIKGNNHTAAHLFTKWSSMLGSTVELKQVYTIDVKDYVVLNYNLAYFAMEEIKLYTNYLKTPIMGLKNNDVRNISFSDIKKSSSIFGKTVSNPNLLWFTANKGDLNILVIMYFPMRLIGEGGHYTADDSLHQLTISLAGESKEIIYLEADIFLKYFIKDNSN